MMGRIWRQAVAACALLLVVAGASPADARDNRNWVLLGEHTVGFQAERDTIRMNRDSNWYSAVRLDASGNDVFVRNLRIIYENGYAETVRVDRMLRAGERAPAIQLPNERSFIRQLELEYRSRPGFGGRAIVQVYGDRVRRNEERVGRRRFERQDLTELATTSVRLRSDRLSLPVERDSGRVSAIRLRATGNPIYVRTVEITFQNGSRQVEQVQQLIDANQPSRLIDLEGNRRSIREVSLELRPQPSRRRSGPSRTTGPSSTCASPR